MQNPLISINKFTNELRIHFGMQRDANSEISTIVSSANEQTNEEGNNYQPIYHAPLSSETDISGDTLFIFSIENFRCSKPMLPTDTCADFHKSWFIIYIVYQLIRILF